MNFSKGARGFLNKLAKGEVDNMRPGKFSDILISLGDNMKPVLTNKDLKIQQREYSKEAIFMTMAFSMALMSKDPRTKVGTVIVSQDGEVLSTGCNGFPRGIDDTVERYADKETKLKLIKHAEENAIINAARVGVSLKQSTLFVTLRPCASCIGTIIQAGIKHIWWYQNKYHDISLLKETDIKIERLTHRLPIIQALLDGHWFKF